MMRRYYMPGVMGLISLLFLFGTALGHDAVRWESLNQVTSQTEATPVLESGDRDTYTGTIRVYVAEKRGRWYDNDGNIFSNAFLGFALVEPISVGETDSLEWSVEWNGADFQDVAGNPYDDIVEGNMKVVAAVFNSASYTNYSDPPSGAPFAVHEVDAVAGAVPGRTGYNVAPTGFTHGVLVEDGATTW